MGEFRGKVCPEMYLFRPLWEAEKEGAAGFGCGGGLVWVRRGAVGLQTGVRILRRRTLEVSLFLSGPEGRGGRAGILRSTGLTPQPRGLPPEFFLNLYQFAKMSFLWEFGCCVTYNDIIRSNHSEKNECLADGFKLIIRTWVGS